MAQAATPQAPTSAAPAISQATPTAAAAASLAGLTSVPQASLPQVVPTATFAQGFPDPASLTNLDAMLELGENAVAMVRQLVPARDEPEERRND